MIGNSDIQAAWIAKLKANTNVTSVVNQLEIRENSWKGSGFSYPCIRLKLTNLVPNSLSNTCQIFRSDLTIMCFSEIKSSKQADDIAKIVATEFWGHPFTYGGVKINSINLGSIVPAYVPDDVDSWLSEVNFNCLLQSA